VVLGAGHPHVARFAQTYDPLFVQAAGAPPDDGGADVTGAELVEAVVVRVGTGVDGLGVVEDADVVGGDDVWVLVGDCAVEEAGARAEVDELAEPDGANRTST
jgi:hypothetical protein